MAAPWPICGAGAAAEFSTPENEDGLAVITGKAPVAEMRAVREVTAYTRCAGRLSCMPRGYAPCHNTEAGSHWLPAGCRY